MTRSVRVDLVASVRGDLRRLGVDAKSTLAMAALDIAVRLGVDGVRPTAAAMLHKELRATLEALERVAAGQPAEDAIDELRTRRANRA
ncbi:hypothetical protein DP939_02510 [Spongiactinospora rosea]|uniref:Uncharacterized protein n=2 Tax=Spongiactinospora TaxID=2871671 RepID=A0A2W2I4S1_9ACTN|nr:MULTISPECIES: hypothetical protein [Spongiactinospora]PZG53147.1 hypothetical protein C1I98_06205 [Spongiactinospora gelatinilytica]RBQ21601.1 hypothetical protein DP939_02510 [Spongiactinospora rosea]